ncbi:MAG: hypothetical protein ACI4IU_01685 [Candidatus Limousia pullorum]
MANPCTLSRGDSLIVCSDLNNFSDYEDQLFLIFKNLYENNSITYNGFPVKMKHYPPDYGERSGFYHLTCENYQHTGSEEDRYPDLRRCERIKWAETILTSCSGACIKLLVWENRRNNKQNILLFCPEVDYLVVLGKRNGYLLLITAYPVSYPNRRKDLLREYEQYKKQTTHPV